MPTSAPTDGYGKRCVGEGRALWSEAERVPLGYPSRSTYDGISGETAGGVEPRPYEQTKYPLRLPPGAMWASPPTKRYQRRGGVRAPRPTEFYRQYA